VPDSTHHTLPGTPTPRPAGAPSNGLPGKTSQPQVQRVLVEILRQAVAAQVTPRGLTRSALTHYFWLAHLYYAKSNPGYLTDWTLVRSPTPFGLEIREAAVLLRELAEEGFVQTEQAEYGPFPVTIYIPTNKDFAPELPSPAVQAIGDAIRSFPGLLSPFSTWPFHLSRAWAVTPEGGELDIYLDLIPEDLYEERRGQLEGLKDALGDLFS
jgi:hypothetical protein